MSKEILDILEPFEEECLYGWVVRMLHMYSGADKIDYKANHIIQYLFGPNVYYISRNFQKGLAYFVEHCNMPSSPIFSSVESILKNMTILPFYLAFKPNEEISKIYDMFSKTYNNRSIENKIGLNVRKPYVEGNIHIKICPLCSKAAGFVYLKREHQISGNFICNKHEVELMYFDYPQNWSSTDDFYDFSKGKKFDLEKNEREKAILITRMIHQIMTKGLQCDICVLKQKIRSKLRSMGYLNHEFLFWDYQSFLKEIEYDIYFRYTARDYVVFHAIYDVKASLNPIYYLVLIDFLFGNLETLYGYEVEFPHGKISPKFSCVKWDIEKKFSCEYYSRTMDSKYLEEYCIVGQTSKEVVIKHRLCGRYYCNDLKRKKLTKCNWCYLYKIPFKDSPVVEREAVSRKYIHFLSTVDYAEKYGKKEKQIRNYCVEGRLQGAVQIGAKNWLIPADAPYPERKKPLRKKKSLVYCENNDFQEEIL